MPRANPIETPEKLTLQDTVLLHVYKGNDTHQKLKRYITRHDSNAITRALARLKTARLIINDGVHWAPTRLGSNRVETVLNSALNPSQGNSNMSNNTPDPVILEAIAAWMDKNEQKATEHDAADFKYASKCLRRIAKRLKNLDLMLIMIAKVMTELPDIDVVHVSTPKNKMDS